MVHLYTLFTILQVGEVGLEFHRGQHTLESFKCGLVDEDGRLEVPNGDGSLEIGKLVNICEGSGLLEFHVMVASGANVCR